VPTLSVCIIARDEAERIAACIASVRRVADELIVLDTGSQDRTESIARLAGAQVTRRAWTEDFAEARNASLRLATSDYVLVLDADERLLPDDAASLRAVVNTGKLDAGLLPIHDVAELGASASEVLSGQSRLGEPRLVPRLFRNTPSLEFEGIIDEHARGWLERQTAVRSLNVKVLHDGPALGTRINPDEALRLRRANAAMYPDDPFAQAALAKMLLDLGENEDAAAVAKRAWLRANSPESGIEAATVRILSLLRCGEPELAREVLQQASERALTHPNLALLLGLVEEHEGVVMQDQSALLRAAGAYTWALKQRHRPTISPVLPGATSWWAQTRLGTVLLVLGHFDEAEEAFRAVTTTEPAMTDGWLGLAESLLGQQKAKQALKILDPLLRTPGADAQVLAYRAYRTLGRTKDASTARAKIPDEPASSLRAPHRIRWLRNTAEDAHAR